MEQYLLTGSSTVRLQFAKLQEEDFESWLEFHRDPLSSLYWAGLPEQPEDACREQFERTFERYRQGLGGLNAVRLKEGDTLAGLCGLLVQQVDGQEELEIGYSILPRLWGKGLATEAARHCRDTAFSMGWAESLISIIQRDNQGSIQVALKNGMHREKSTTYKNNPVYIYRIFRQNHS